jgi:murein L,D-transpeptidase YafK
MFSVIVSHVMAKTNVPSSDRSKSAIERVKTNLEKELSTKGLKYGLPIFIRIFKHSSELEIWLKKKGKYQLFKTYPICTYGDGGLGPKQKHGDGHAPEGFYSVFPRSMNPSSNYHLAFNLGYPNEYDRSQGRTGSALMVHGNCVSIGCFAMTDPVIEEIYALADAALRNGQEFFLVHIFPFRMTDENMRLHADSQWYGFWENLKEGYDLFEENKVPPTAMIRSNKYIF